MANKNFEDYGFKPSAVIEALNKWYEHGGYRFFSIELPDSKEGDRKFHVFRTNPEAAIDDAIKHLRSFDIFYQPGLKWDDVKYKLNSRACLAEFGFDNVHDAWTKVNPAIDQRKIRDGEIRDYILERTDMNDIKVPMTFRTGAVEDLIAYLFALLMQERKNKELAEKIQEQYRERADGYLEKIDRLQKELDSWDCWYNDKEHYVK